MIPAFALADGADVFIAECYFFRKPVRFHLNYPDIAKQRSGPSAWSSRNLGRAMLANLDQDERPLPTRRQVR